MPAPLKIRVLGGQMSLTSVGTSDDGRDLYLQTCPWALLNSPAVTEVYQAHAHWSKSQLALWEPNPSVQLMAAVIAFDNGLEKGRYDKIKRDRKDAEYKRRIEDITSGNH